MTSVAVLVPVLNRPGSVKALVDSLATATPQPYRLLFLCDPADRATRDQIALAGAQVLSPGGSYAAKIRAGVQATSESLIFTGADDLTFHPGWLQAAREHIDAGAQVVGVNDLIARRPGREHHATHFLMTRAYAQQPTIDGKPGPFSDAYHHNFCDDELIATAQRRGVYAYAADAHVEHRHPMNGTAPDDDTYRLGRARFRIDRRTFQHRAPLWTSR